MSGEAVNDTYTQSVRKAARTVCPPLLSPPPVCTTPERCPPGTLKRFVSKHGLAALCSCGLAVWLPRPVRDAHRRLAIRRRRLHRMPPAAWQVERVSRPEMCQQRKGQRTLEQRPGLQVWFEDVRTTEECRLAAARVEQRRATWWPKLHALGATHDAQQIFCVRMRSTSQPGWQICERAQGCMRSGSGTPNASKWRGVLVVPPMYAAGEPRHSGPNARRCGGSGRVSANSSGRSRRRESCAA